MEREGSILKKYIDNQKGTIKSIAEGLEMSRSNLYQLFKSEQLEFGTKEKIKNYFGFNMFEDFNMLDESNYVKQPIPLTRGRFAYLMYPSDLVAKDIEIIAKAIDMVAESLG